MRSSVRIYFFAAILLVFFVSPTGIVKADLDSNRATALIRVERGLKQNEFHLKAINSTISNYGSEEDRALYRRCLQHHIETFTLYLQFDLAHSYDEMRQTQRLLVVLYSRVVESSAMVVRRELDYLAKYALRTQDAEARHHLEMGYREFGASNQKKVIALNHRPNLPGIKTQYLYESLKLLKQSREYVTLLSLKFLSDFEPDLRSSEFEEIYNEINRAMFTKSDHYAKIHFDNHFVIYNAENLYESTWQNPGLQELEKALGDIDPASDRARRMAKRSMTSP
ncbi:hypothetical protein EHQ53_08870 [Leptospira langatensis]|uniref:Uncharacterized protein n=1 Tax=Leptospira langatensis TaxID=2484983 RepID=A0A5F1ZXI2_9LEPT|nr:hypothetical protein [Leptospira langatensis]TGK01262.1 hypothetical protein EHO57_10000 [Leptospira langatensis]TGL42285.1 hypothetical protein EHQ53_08870 [Leptospira langatensis]